MPTKVDNQSLGMRNRYSHYQGGNFHSGGTSQYVIGWQDTRSGDSVPRWREKIRRGQNATSGYSMSVERHHAVNVDAYASLGPDTSWGPSKYEWYYSGTLQPGYAEVDSPFGQDVSIADRLAREHFVRKYRERRTQFQGGVFLGELTKLVQMIKSPASALRRGVDSYYGTVKKRSRGKPPSKRVIQDTWLEYQMGWKPLINDVEDACKLATAHPYAFRENISAQGIQLVAASKTKSFSTYGAIKADHVRVSERESIVKYKGAVSAETSPPPFPEQLGLSWSNVLPTVWELIPYSFLVDYFTNVGKVIDGISTGRIFLAWGCRVQLQKSKASIEAVKADTDWTKSFNPSGKSTAYATGGGPSGHIVVFNRTLVNSVSVGIGDASFKLPGSNTRWLNIAALANLRR